MIYELLPEGKENAVSGSTLVALTGLSSKRTLQAVVRKEREAGKPICATSDSRQPGYYRPDSRQDMQRYCDHLKSCAIELLVTRKACLKTLDTLPDKPDAETAADAKTVGEKTE